MSPRPIYRQFYIDLVMIFSDLWSPWHLFGNEAVSWASNVLPPRLNSMCFRGGRFAPPSLALRHHPRSIRLWFRPPPLPRISSASFASHQARSLFSHSPIVTSAFPVIHQHITSDREMCTTTMRNLAATRRLIPFSWSVYKRLQEREGGEEGILENTQRITTRGDVFPAEDISVKY